MIKTNKSYTKRIKVTRRGKLIARKAGQNHFNAKESRNKRLGRRRSASVIMKNKDVSRFLATK